MLKQARNELYKTLRLVVKLLMIEGTLNGDCEQFVKGSQSG